MDLMNSLISKQSMNHQERKEMLKSFLLIFMELLHWMPPNTSKDSHGVQQRYCNQLQGGRRYDSKLKKKIFGKQWVHTWIETDNQKAGLQYVSGYVFQNLHKKYCKANSIESQQAMAILKTGKLDSMNLNTQKQELISSLSREGLWTVTLPAFKIFLKTDDYFSQRIDIVWITKTQATDGDVLANYQLIPRQTVVTFLLILP